MRGDKREGEEEEGGNKEESWRKGRGREERQEETRTSVTKNLDYEEHYILSLVFSHQFLYSSCP